MSWFGGMSRVSKPCMADPISTCLAWATGCSGCNPVDVALSEIIPLTAVVCFVSPLAALEGLPRPGVFGGGAETAAAAATGGWGIAGSAVGAGWVIVGTAGVTGWSE